jgi:hypothetical protein
MNMMPFFLALESSAYKNDKKNGGQYDKKKAIKKI